MEWLYEWIRGIVFYMILMTMVFHLLPDRKYEKYVRLFAGMILILLVFRPFADMTGMEERLAAAFGRITFQNDVRLLRRELEAAGEQKARQLADSYQRAVEMDLAAMAEGSGLRCEEARAWISVDGESGMPAGIAAVELVIGGMGDGAAESGSAAEGNARDAERLSAGSAADSASVLSRGTFRGDSQAVAGLKRRIGEYYGVEEGKITIRFADE